MISLSLLDTAVGVFAELQIAIHDAISKSGYPSRASGGMWGSIGTASLLVTARALILLA